MKFATDNNWLVLVLFSLFFLIACAPGHSSDSQPSPTTSANSGKTSPTSDTQSRARLVSPSIQINRFQDVRDASIALDDEKEFHQIKGDVEGLVAKTFQRAFRKKGYLLLSDSSRKIRGEIRKWHTVASRATGSIQECEAELFVEVVDAKGSVLFGKVYRGVQRVKNQDDLEVKISLGMAMEQAVNQTLVDQELASALAK